MSDGAGPTGAGPDPRPGPDAPDAVRVGTRGSALALTQTGHVAEALVAAGVPGGRAVELVRIRTEGDRHRGSLAAMGGAGVFVTALRDALLQDRCDVAVHSLKDLPVAPADGLVVAAVPQRVDPRDALCARDGLTLATLPSGARVGTGSPRRAAQLRAVRPDLEVLDIRGNVGTRLGRVPGLGDGPGDLDAVVLAAAGLTRLGQVALATELLDPTAMAPAPGQGALAVELRADGSGDDGALLAAVTGLDHLPTRLAVTAERELLGALEAGCAAPIGALAHLDRPDHPGADAHLTLDAVVCRPDGSAVLRASASVRLDGAAWVDPATGGLLPAPTGAAPAPVDAARTLGRELAAQLLTDGAADLAPVGPGR